MRAESRLSIVAAVAVGALAIPRTADAFCRTTTVPVPADFSPSGGTCFTQGEPLYHPSQCVTYEVATAGVGAITARVIADSFARAFASWSAPNAFCLPGVTVVQVGTVEGPVEVGYKANAPGENANVVGFVAGPWPHGTTGDTLALTTITFRADDGRILDADTEINRDVPWSVARPLPSNDYDLDTAMLHEAGHFLGLAHSATADAAMFASYTVGTSRARLDDDDLRGMCAIYPSRDARTTRTGQVASLACNLAPDTGGGSSCGEPNVVHGCTVTPAASGRHDESWWATALALSLALVASCYVRRSKR